MVQNKANSKLSNVDTRVLAQLAANNQNLAIKVDCGEEQLPTKNFNRYGVSTHLKEAWYGNPKSFPTVLLIDFGVKHSIIQELLAHGAGVHSFPFTKLNQLPNLDNYNIIVLSNGPFHHEQYKNTLPFIQKMMQSRKPIWGICLGIQLLLLANETEMTKLKTGHRRQNYPIVEMDTQRFE